MGLNFKSLRHGGKGYRGGKPFCWGNGPVLRLGQKPERAERSRTAAAALHPSWQQRSPLRRAFELPRLALIDFDCLIFQPVIGRWSFYRNRGATVCMPVGLYWLLLRTSSSANRTLAEASDKVLARTRSASASPSAV
jgi:hypothetical protein